MNEWLSARADALAAAAGVDRAELELSDDAEDRLLQLAGHAAHASGARTNAPLLCYLVGIAHARGTSLEQLDETVRSTS
ncbi:MAG TPA: DUF6457 domain-containing protein [Gaiellaceae bacterium]|nr:DUF6457 domain-containing protein [Gaiellaceae bacterium]